MKKIKSVISILLVLVVLLTFCSCKKLKKDIEDFLSVTEIEDVLGEIEDKLNDENAQKGTSPSTSKTSSISTKTSDVQVEKTITTDGKIVEPKIEKRIDAISLNNKHSAVLPSDYYQYNTLTQPEKTLYNKINEVIKKSGSMVDLSDVAVRESQVVSVFKKLLADNPQYFYVSRCCMTVYSQRNKIVRAVFLLYTDGSVTDEFNDNMNFVKKADRDVINKKISKLESALSSVISKIPSDTSNLIKEKKIHDFIVNTVTYDNKALDNLDDSNITLPHSFDLYGALIEGSAVCEGYSKLFQYLNYCVGINSTQVFGTSSGENHMWNTVNIDNCWYQVDVTWDDSSEIATYNYFNLTTEDILKDHKIDSTDIAVPQCVSNINSFHNAFSVWIESLNNAPKNYDRAIKNVISAGDKYIYLYFEIGKQNVEQKKKYIRQYIANPTSEFNVYLIQKGITVSNTFGELGEYIILTIQ